MLDIVLIAGSSRPDSQSAKVAHFLRQRLITLGKTSADSSQVIDLGSGPLPLWPAEDSGTWADYGPRLQRADAVVVIAPEWNGMACPAIKNFFIYASKAELAHKPGLLVGVSSGIGGGSPIAELRSLLQELSNQLPARAPDHPLGDQGPQRATAGERG